MTMDKQRQIDDNTPIAMLTVGDLRKIFSIDKILDHLSPVNEMSSEIMTIEEVAATSSYSKTSIYRFTHERKIPFHKPAHGGRRLCFNRKEILDWMQARSIQTTEQYCEGHINSLNK